MKTKAIHYDASSVARMVGFCLISPRPRIQRETRESLPALRSMAAGKREPSLAVRTYLGLLKKGEGYVWTY